MIYDCFVFFNELELLEIRLAELPGVVDRFVLVESTRTFSDRSKPLFFLENRAKFAEFADRIIHVIVDDMPGGPDPWARERHQRNCIMRGLQGCADEDYILISDVDEIPRAAAVPGRRELLGFVQRMNYYYLNFARPERWLGTRSLQYGLLKQLPSVQLVRDTNTQLTEPNGGWHFSYLGGARKIREKLDAFSHQELNKPEFTDAKHLTHAMREGSDLFGRDFAAFELVAMSDLPAHIVKHRNRFRNLLWSDLGDEACSDEDCSALESAYRKSDGAAGEVVEISPGRGGAACVLANICYPRELAVALAPPDSAASAADVAAVFCKNIRSLTLENIRRHDGGLAELLAKDSNPWRFCHVGRAAQLRSGEIQAIADRLSPGGVICGETPRPDSAAILPNVQVDGKFWSWQKARATSAGNAGTMIPELDRVTLFCIDTAQPMAALRAMNLSQKQAQFAESILVTTEEFADAQSPGHPEIEFIGIPVIQKGAEYSRLVMKEIAGIVQTSHVLLVQWDGYVLNGSRWSDEFLQFDYIGSIWAKPMAGRRVGNGGFSLRSKRLLDLLALPATPCYHPEDVATCVELRPMLESKGIQFADERVAAQFSFEQVESASETFGFHGAFNLWRMISAAEIGPLLDSIAPHNLSTPPIVNLMKAYAARNRWDEALQVLQRIEKSNSPQEAARIISCITDGDIEKAKGVQRDIHARGATVARETV
jgi:beta-1,4-mannosyl-glycoprotein beta-1,4-N-acetylglucosaminyltransferase